MVLRESYGKMGIELGLVACKLSDLLSELSFGSLVIIVYFIIYYF